MNWTDLAAADIEATFGFTSKWISTRAGERIHYLDEGTSNHVPVVLVHGSAIGITAAANFYLTVPALVQAGYRVIAPDLYGYGLTETPPDVNASRPHHVEQLVRLLDALDLEHCYLIGNSLGGMVSADMAIRHPQRVLGNIVIGTAGARWQHGSRFEPQLSARADTREYLPDMVRKAMLHLVHNPETLSEDLIEFRTRMAERPGAWARHIESTRLREETKKRYPFDVEAARTCPVPTLIVYGREDRISPPEDALAAAEAFPNADLMLFGHCGHWTMVERADDFNALMLRFLSGGAERVAQPPIRGRELRAQTPALREVDT